jgi:hypothetical protein
LSFGLQSKYDLKDKSQLLYLIRKKPEGIAVIDLKDAYPTVMEDLQVHVIFDFPILFDELLHHDIHAFIIAPEFCSEKSLEKTAGPFSLVGVSPFL